MTGYLIVELDYDDPSWVESYTRDVPTMLKAYGGRYLVCTTRAELLEGDRPPSFITAIFEFPTLADDRALLRTAAYRPYADSCRARGTTQMLGPAGRYACRAHGWRYSAACSFVSKNV